MNKKKEGLKYDLRIVQKLRQIQQLFYDNNRKAGCTYYADYKVCRCASMELMAPKQIMIAFYVLNFKNS